MKIAFDPPLVTMYAPVTIKAAKGNRNRGKLWKELNDLLKGFENGRKVMVIGVWMEK